MSTLPHLPLGVPTLRDLDALQSTDTYRAHTEFNRAFLSRHGAAMAKYGKHWGLNPFKLWSRRWEYPFVASRLIDFATSLQQQQGGDAPIKILDAGSGVTYFPYFVNAAVPSAQFICCDYDPSYEQMFREINAAEAQPPRVQFLQAPLQKLPLPDASLDAVCCISVLEHTNNYDDIVDEFARVLKDRGAFILTFDLSLDGRHTLPKPLAAALIKKVLTRFQVPPDIDLLAALDHMHDDGVLNTEHVRATEPELLPWTTPVKIYKSFQDLFKGYGWTGGFRSRTVFCLDVRRKTRAEDGG